MRVYFPACDVFFRMRLFFPTCNYVFSHVKPKTHMWVFNITCENTKMCFLCWNVNNVYFTCGFYKSHVGKKNRMRRNNWDGFSKYDVKSHAFFFITCDFFFPHHIRIMETFKNVKIKTHAINQIRMWWLNSACEY